MLEEALKALVLAVLVEQGLVEAPKGKKGGKKAAEPDPADDDVTMDTLKAKITQLVNKKGKPAAVALLKKAKIEKLAELAEKHYEAFNKKLDEELGEEAEDDDLFGE